MFKLLQFVIFSLCSYSFGFKLQQTSSDEALNHEWFRELPLPKSKEFMPTCPPLNDHDRLMTAPLEETLTMGWILFKKKSLQL